jgi:hypothetical protein
MLQAMAKLRLFGEAPAVAEHIAVAGNTHDPFIYMDTFLGLFS